MSTDARRRYASAAFITLLILSLSWPSPIVSANRLWLDRDLAVDELSFLGREAPSWDVVFFCLAGLLALAILQSGEVRDWRATLRRSIAWNPGALCRRPARWAAAALAGALAVALTWFLLDAPVLAWAERIRSDTTQALVRGINRFGGGMNPPMIVLFFAVAGVAYRTPRWIRYAAAMALAALGAGAVAHILKFLVGRARPELWLGPFHYARGAANSFPSGHTVGAFALAGVLLFASKSLPLRIIALLLAVAAGLARILAFRHWTSDVVASALLGLMAAWVAVRVLSAPPPAADGRPRG
ncbi:MAG TPA: phosphatase PAP2 family protein [Thermoanaerobaculia bacterium]|nr:phosphatase PAP2 family protein [Thermoanaerobaculia bacterium]